MAVAILFHDLRQLSSKQRMITELKFLFEKIQERSRLSSPLKVRGEKLKKIELRSEVVRPVQSHRLWQSADLIVNGH